MSDELTSDITEKELERMKYCDPTTENCDGPDTSQYILPHFFLWFITIINAAVPIIYWFVSFKPELDANLWGKAVLEKNFWWMEFAWPIIVFGHAGLYGVAAFFGIWSWARTKFFNLIYEFWIERLVLYVGTPMHFFACLGFLAGAAFWRP